MSKSLLLLLILSMAANACVDIVSPDAWYLIDKKGNPVSIVVASLDSGKGLEMSLDWGYANTSQNNVRFKLIDPSKGHAWVYGGCSRSGGVDASIFAYVREPEEGYRWAKDVVYAYKIDVDKGSIQSLSVKGLKCFVGALSH